jgi:tRNA(Ile)-lysidine synthase TilS/MesJ
MVALTLDDIPRTLKLAFQINAPIAAAAAQSEIDPSKVLQQQAHPFLKFRRRQRQQFPTQQISPMYGSEQTGE